MKKIFLFTVLLCSFSSFSQSMGYNDLGALFTSDDNYGTARFRGMSGAFGALGGDLSAITINPAGAAIFLNSEVSASMSFRNEAINSNYYGTNTKVTRDFTNFSQIGGVFVFNTGQSNWSKTSIAFNYNTQKDFQSRWAANGNSNYPTFIYDDEDNLYLYTDGQYFDNYTDGRNDKYTFSFASQYSDKLYIGASFTTNDIRFYQSVYLEEDNHDGDGNRLLGQLSEDLSTWGTGYSFNLGIISRPNENIRLGLAYQSPTWYNLIEEFYSEGNLNGFDYSMRSPSKTTASFAYIFNQSGLISLDYAYKNYSGIELSPDYDFSEENRIFDTDFRGTSEVRLGTEWRFKKLSARGGFHYQQSPYNGAPSSFDVNGFSVGLGYNFGFAKLDFAYEDSNYNSTYDFYPQYDEVDAAYLTNDNSKITATLVFSI